MTQLQEAAQDESEAVFATAAELFSLLSTPIRLKIISSLCRGEKNVSQLLDDIGLNGTLTLEDRPGPGACFRVQLEVCAT